MSDATAIVICVFLLVFGTALVVFKLPAAPKQQVRDEVMVFSLSGGPIVLWFEKPLPIRTVENIKSHFQGHIPVQLSIEVINGVHLPDQMIQFPERLSTGH